MEFLTQLWMPIVVSAAAVWIASAVIWMALPHHKKDWDKLPDEDAFRNYVKSAGIAPGNYGYPHFGSHKECNSPEAKARWENGPVGMLSVWGKVSMGRNMLLTFLVFLAVSVVIAYLAAMVIPMGAPIEFKHVFRFVGSAGVVAYCFSFLPNGIWFGQYPRAMLMCMIDGVAYGLITGAVFGMLWPGG